MSWEDLLSDFRALGGVAENVRVDRGTRGRGAFVVDPSKPSTLRVPEVAMVPVDAVELRDGELRVSRERVDENVAQFFERYQRIFGWSAGGRDEAIASQREWSTLPNEVVSFIKTMGVLDHPDRRFTAPDEEICFQEYIRARIFRDNGPAFMIPVVDLVNHSSPARGFIRGDGVEVSGSFADEVVVRYQNIDAMATILEYGFSDLSAFAYSTGITVDLPGGKRLSVARDITAYETRNGLGFPAVSVAGDTIRLSYLMLGIIGAADAPRAIFRSIMKPFMEAPAADEVFDGIAHFNRTRFLDLLRTLRKYDGRLVLELQDASINQLQALSSCIGARTL